MAINPNDITTVRVGQLPSEPFNLTDEIPHEVGTELKRGTLQSMADVIGAYLDVSGGVGFRAVTVNDGETLPATTEEEFILVGAGTFFNVGGGPTIVTTENLNALVSNGTYWFIGVEIPVTVNLGDYITQFIRSGFLNTAPSEDAVFNALAGKVSSGDLNNFTPTDKICSVDNEQTITIPVGHKPLSVHLNSAFQHPLTSTNAARIDIWTQVGNVITLTQPTFAGDYIFVLSQ